MKSAASVKLRPTPDIDTSGPGVPDRNSVVEVRRRGPSARVVAPLGVLAAMFGAWSFVSHVILDPDRRFLLPPPESVVLHGLLDGGQLAEMLGALVSTAEVALVGLGISIVVGVAVGVLMSQARWVEYSIYPYAIVLQTIPILAVVPLLGYWFGFDFESRVIVCVLVSLFPLITNTLYGLQSVDAGHHDLFTLMRASRRQRFMHLQLPAALPAIITGCKISAGLAVIGSIVADFFFRQGDPGIGRLIDIYRQRLATEQLMTALFLSSLLGLLLFAVFEVLGRVVDRRRGVLKADV
ncbi:MAG TPA: ABC transporter permease [Polyangiaceae bacterium]|jgi:NitT/TauT family transport system permease protein|nr:ABC transporter permease [Polyangiaceae bacterium]